jgi:hypothetical protein
MERYNPVKLSFPHGSNIEHKLKTLSDRKRIDLLKKIKERYIEWKNKSMEITGTDRKNIEEKSRLFEEYKDFIDRKEYAEAFDPRGVLHSTAIEEFLVYLFVDLVKHMHSGLGQIYIGRAEVPKSIIFSPSSFRDMLKTHALTFIKTSVDFVIGCEMEVSYKFYEIIKGLIAEKTTTEKIIAPAVCVECKTYVDKPMLDRCNYEAEAIKRVFPSCLYIVVSEYIKLEERERPSFYINQVYTLRKQKTVDRAVRLDVSSGWKKNPIDHELVWDLFTNVKRHLEESWWEPGAALTKGKLVTYRH